MGEEAGRKKRRKKKHYILKLILLIAFCTGMYFFISSHLFDIQKISVKGNEYYSSKQVTAIAKAEAGGNLFKTHVKEMKDRLINDPYIRNARISKRLPGELILTVEERKEIGAVPYGEEYLIIDREGIVLRQTDEDLRLTMLSGMTLSNIKIGTALEAEEESLLKETLRLLNSMEEHKLFFKKIQCSGFQIRAYVNDNLYCQGSPENILKSMDDLEDVLYDLYVQGIERGVIKIGGKGYYSFSALVE